MKANELMIGDWFNFLIDVVGGETEHDPAFNEYHPMQIDSVSTLGEVSSAFFGVTNDVAQIKPITLTAEILGKNFTVDNPPSEAAYSGVRYTYSNDFFDVEITEYTDGLWQVEVDEIEMGGMHTWRMFVSNVHELQHALRLCGIYKEIKL